MLDIVYRERVVTHQSRHSQCRGNLGELGRLDSDGTKLIPRLCSVCYGRDSLGHNDSTGRKYQRTRIGEVGVHMIVARVEQQDKYSHYKCRASPECLLDVVLTQIEEAINHIVIASRGHTREAHHHEQEVEDDGYAIDTLEKRYVISVSLHCLDNVVVKRKADSLSAQQVGDG